MSNLFGRRAISVTFGEELDVGLALELAVDIHNKNMGEIDKLYDYYVGKQGVLDKVKHTRDEINNKVVENRANEIVEFKLGYCFGEPIQYVSRSADDAVSDKISQLGDFMVEADKDAEDISLAEWILICGTGYRMLLPSVDSEEDGTPFLIYTLDPRNAFVVYDTDLRRSPIMGVKFIDTEAGRVYSVYTEDKYYEYNEDYELISGSESANTLGFVPIFEYRANTARLGAFEVVMPLLDALNLVLSNRLDDVEEFVNAFMALYGADMDKEQQAALKENKLIILPNGSKVELVTAGLQQADIQVLSDSLYNSILTICGMPSRSGGMGRSTSDSGAAVEMRDGWSAAETHAKRIELNFKRSERLFLRAVLKMLRDLNIFDARVSDIEVKFTRRNYEATLSQVNMLTQMLDNGQIHPQLAFSKCGLFADSEKAYLMSREYIDSVSEHDKTQSGNEPT